MLDKLNIQQSREVESKMNIRGQAFIDDERIRRLSSSSAKRESSNCSRRLNMGYSYFFIHF
ncbi:hypothetical protein E1A91_D06G102400v1 [Gossypium mustelinum]|uniref:Uncharacterized protein n=1 Tax=Gossypium mustelinum TaxID=34275 RepID=A0A5D2UJ34_GOSMU|nr:hypothetical protein E1A91_D06G102400v1 [Gossypium mustelinum]